MAAVGANGVIGDGSGMPWHLPEDLRHFKRLTMGGVLLMGRRTFDSIGSALPGRRTVVITRNASWRAEGVQVAQSLPEALLIAGGGEVFVVGGGEIYRQCISDAHRLVVTEVHQRPDGSVKFPTIDPHVWAIVEREPHDGFDITTWARRSPEAV
ncbi:MAG TPA: dihydrofolate reductase [Ornithinimicrobium sp.]|uniref:dihydrofolate reductase n=1 Tax=Ornithinimicrobium sp. TaxID=1977084 RepID=UPI002B477E63|nr:dihydrofolate reductase [Ornithinimicrobium sp.]HKJ12242.1 dihydrofolate reductase [Ornithinimicrobium sp.]